MRRRRRAPRGGRRAARLSLVGEVELMSVQFVGGAADGLRAASSLIDEMYDGGRPSTHA